MCPRFGVLGRVLPLAMIVLACAILGLGQTAPDAGAERLRQSDMTVVVSVRHYLASAQTSYYHLCLYSGDGTLVRQLTNENGANDVDPILSPDGNQVCFRRFKVEEGPASSDAEDNTTATYHLVADLRAASPEREIPAPPEWCRPASKPSPDAAKPGPSELANWDGAATLRYPSPDGAYQIAVHCNWPGEKSDPQGAWDMNVTFWLTDLKTSTTERLARMQGFEALSGACDSRYYAALPDRPYLYEGPLHLVFFFCHLGSTFGSSIRLFDLNRRAFTELTPCGGLALTVIPGVPGFFFVCEKRYQPLGYRNRTVNCRYLDFWNSEMKRTRFAPELSEFGGAAAYIPGHGVTVIP